MEHEPGATDETHKLEPKYRGPYVTARMLGKDRYIEGISGLKVTCRKYSCVQTSGRLKPWSAIYPDLEISNNEDNGDDESQSQERPSCHLAMPSTTI